MKLAQSTDFAYIKPSLKYEIEFLLPFLYPKEFLNQPTLSFAFCLFFFFHLSFVYVEYITYSRILSSNSVDICLYDVFFL